ncbi:MAG: acyl carrier protein [Pseudonocardiaceae bacterium]
MQNFTLDHLKEALRAAAGVDGSVDLDGDVLDTPFEELGYDSLAMLELAGRVQRDFRVPMPDDARHHMPTPRAALTYINARFVETGV